MAIRDEVLKEVLEGYKRPEDLLGPEGDRSGFVLSGDFRRSHSPATKEFGKKRIEFRKGDGRRFPANFSHGQIRPLKSSYTKNRILP